MAGTSRSGVPWGRVAAQQERVSALSGGRDNRGMREGARVTPIEVRISDTIGPGRISPRRATEEERVNVRWTRSPRTRVQQRLRLPGRGTASSRWSARLMARSSALTVGRQDMWWNSAGTSIGGRRRRAGGRRRRATGRSRGERSSIRTEAGTEPVGRAGGSRQ